MIKKYFVSIVLLGGMCVLMAMEPAFSSSAIPASALVCGESAQNFLKEGDTGEALKILGPCTERFSGSDWLHSLYGRALFSAGRLDEAEDQFQRALDISKDSPVAKLMVLEVRQTKDLLKDKEMDAWLQIARSKTGDLAVIILGVWLGTMMSGCSAVLGRLFKRSRFERALHSKDWDVVTDIFEYLIFSWKKDELRENMNKMLEKYSVEEVEEIVRKYVDHEKHEANILFFLHKMVDK